MSKGHIVYIIGFMGSGKSTAGRKLASLLGWSFTDLDAKIVEFSGMKIPEIFSKYGEDHFRRVESEVLRSLDSATDTVVSTGGGTPCHLDNMDFMLGSGLTIYLKLTPGQLRSRLTGSSTERPLIKGLHGNDLQSFIEEKLASREKWYNMADIIHEGFDTDINLLHTQVRSKLGF
jgi:shikimate kinase